jgi:processive 1,2-diacylglycerol beta-glucosyltransferase
MKVLILHASAGAGHKRAAEALANAFALEDPSAEVVVRDILDFTAPMFRKSYGKGYLDVVRKAPELWGYMFSQSDKKALLPSRKAIRAIFNEINTLAFGKFCREFDADFVVCTHFMPLEILAHKSKWKCGDVPLYCVVTDFAVHSLWVIENVDRYYVATDDARRQLIRKGQPEDKIRITGIPVDPVFSKSERPEDARRKLGIAAHTPTALLLSGGFGVGPTVDLIRSFGHVDVNCQLLVVAGANEKLKNEAIAAADGLKIPVKVFGFVNNIHELMDASDVVISKPGGLTTSEVLAKGKPMIVIDPIPGQEQRNCEYLLEAGAALRLYDPEDAPYKVQALLDNPERLERMKRRAREIGHPFAALEIVRDIQIHRSNVPSMQPRKRIRLKTEVQLVKRRLRSMLKHDR